MQAMHRVLACMADSMCLTRTLEAAEALVRIYASGAVANGMNQDSLVLYVQVVASSGGS